MPKKAASKRKVEDEVDQEPTENEDQEPTEEEEEKKKTTKKQKSTTTTTTTTTGRGKKAAPKKATKADEIDEEEEKDGAEDAEDGEDGEEESSETTVTAGSDDLSEPAVGENQVKIISWNVAGFKSCSGKGFRAYVEKEQPDILCLQETKIELSKVAALDSIPKGYEYHFNVCEKPGFHGTALLTKIKPISVSKGIGIGKHDNEGRVITAEFEKFYVVNSYVPNSGVDRKKPLARLDYRTKEWDVDFFNYMRKLNEKKPVIWCGDLNVAHKEIDLKNPKTNARTAGFTIEERNSFNGFLESGFVDTYRHFNPKKEGAYTFWSYMRNARASNAGWRLDYFIVPLTFIGSIAHSFMRNKVTGSDHCPIGVIVENK